jgi:hypothetical protein
MRALVRKTKALPRHGSSWRPSKANSIADGDERMARIDARRSAAGVLK